eukprot:1157224-Pelagomonas_calceolata.AAC.6
MSATAHFKSAFLTPCFKFFNPTYSQIRAHSAEWCWPQVAKTKGLQLGQLTANLSIITEEFV